MKTWGPLQQSKNGPGFVIRRKLPGPVADKRLSTSANRVRVRFAGEGHLLIEQLILTTTTTNENWFPICYYTIFLSTHLIQTFCWNESRFSVGQKDVDANIKVTAIGQMNIDIQGLNKAFLIIQHDFLDVDFANRWRLRAKVNIVDLFIHILKGCILLYASKKEMIYMPLTFKPFTILLTKPSEIPFFISLLICSSR